MTTTTNNLVYATPNVVKPYIATAKLESINQRIYKKIILCRGIQGSGKTTWANKWVAEDPKTRVKFNNDDIRNMLGGHNPHGYWVPDREVLVSHLKKEFLYNAMMYGFDIVIDNMNLNPREVKFYQDIVENYMNPDPKVIRPDMYMPPYRIIFKDFFIPVEECIRRDAERENPITEKVIRATYEKYKDILESK